MGIQGFLPRRWKMGYEYLVRDFVSLADSRRPTFREVEYREWLIDVISMVAIKREDATHDTKLINSILEETCEDWGVEKSDYIGFMIGERMKRRR